MSSNLPWPAPESTKETARHIHSVVREFYDLDYSTVEHIVQETLFKACQDLRQGKTVQLEYLGTLTPENDVISFQPDKEWLQARPLLEIVK